MFTNLLTNACEAMKGCGAITISASMATAAVGSVIEAAEQAIVVDVADTGPGVPAELTERIFTPFFTTKPEGSGLGLSIVSKIVHAHNGRIDVSSSGAGTTFRVTLPIEHAFEGATAKD
jgi:signal transduction histidine kinase